MAWCPTALPSVPHNEGRSLKVHSRFELSARLRRVADDGSRWRGPARPHGSDADRKNGSAASELRCRCASLHHGSGQQETLRIQACGAIRAPSKRAPLRSSSRPQRACCRARGRQGVAWQRWSLANGRERRPTLTAPARDSVWDVWVGTWRNRRAGIVTVLATPTGARAPCPSVVSVASMSASTCR